MATSDKSLTPPTLVDHVEISTDSTGEREKFEPSFSQPTAGPAATKEEGSAKLKDQGEPQNTISTVIDATSASPTITLQAGSGTPGVLAGVTPGEATPGAGLMETEAKKKGSVAAIGIGIDIATAEGKKDSEENKSPSSELPLGENRSTLSMPSPPEHPMTAAKMQRSKSEIEVESAAPSPVVIATAIATATAIPPAPSGTSDSNREIMGSVDEASHLQELLTSQNVNNQIVERSPGERYVRFSEKLGSGASKDVYRSYDTEEGIEVAWNVVHLAGVPKTERNRIVNEVRLLERLHHQNIISFHGSWINREQQQVNFVTEILSSGTLKSFINKVQVIRWKIAKRWAVQILKGLEYLHSQDPPVIHRDLKCENIFINGTSGDLRIGDLGLSTSHRNGKALSVLGTPEFMAPDMYEEASYDEKVDIYAFGMCLLEIFTKEIPYKECTNPAQIYKKVTRGAPPDSLGRLKSTHARKFIELCLGYRNEEGNYVRPSAKELLDHPFLVKRSVDDEEVEVDPPLKEQTILETVTRSSERSIELKGANATTSASTSQSQNNLTPTKEALRTMRHTMHQSVGAYEEEESDRFEEMPDSEVNNMKKVKVMMGRGEELKEDDVVEADTDSRKRSTTDANSSAEVGSLSSLQNVQQSNDTNGKKLHYLVAAAVIEENKQSSTFQQQPPYHDDILKLVITLPVEGETQNVQFDFDLVEDDPIQVAKEMVDELSIPEEAVLEISETVSGLARVARTKKHKFNSAKAQQNPGLVRSNSIINTRSNATSQPPQLGQTAVAQQQQHMGQSMMQPTNQQQAVQDYIPSQQHQMQQPSGQPIQQQQSLPLQDQSVAMHGQQMVDNTAIPTQMQHIQQQRAMTQTGDAESLHQTPVPYVQAGMEISSQMEASNHQLQHAQINGKYHHQGHVSSETKHPLAPYGQSSVPPPIPSLPISNTASQNSHSQIPQQLMSQQSHGTHDTQSNPPGATYPPAAPNQRQSQTVQYTPNLVQQAPAHVAQPVGSGQQAMPSTLQQPQHMPNQQMHGGSQGLSQGYTQHQQLQPSMQHTSLPQQQQQPQIVQQSVQQPVQQIQNIPQQQHLQNDVQQPSSMQLQMNHQSSLSQQQQLQQPVTNQQHQMQQGISQQMDQQHQMQQGISQHMDHHQQQQPITQQHSGHTLNPQPNQSNAHVSEYQVPSNQVQRIPTGPDSMNLPILYDKSTAGDFVPVVQQHEARRVRSQDIISTTDPLTAINSKVRSTSLGHEQEDTSQGESVGVLEGLSIVDTSLEYEPTDEVFAEELRKLDQNYQNNLKRSEKVFVARMDNLQRTQVQREAIHQKTLKQHQKERTAFEKRLQQEEIEQNRRIEQMQKEWDKKREEVRLKDKA